MMTILKRELRAYFLSPLAYVFMAGFFIVSGIFFMLINMNPQSGGVAQMNATLSNMKLVLLFIIPALTMRLISEERSNKTDQLLMTSPTSIVAIVFGKFFAAASVFFVTLVLSFIYPAILYKFGSPSTPELLNAYLGFFLLGLSFIAICLFASSLSDSQVIAFIIGFSSILSFWLIGLVQDLVSNKILSSIINWISLLKRYDDFAQGILRPGPIVYYISVVILFVFFTIRKIEKRRWSEG